MSNILVFVLELIGTVAFAVSGAIVGIKKQMDLLGVIVLGVCTAVGLGVFTVVGVQCAYRQTEHYTLFLTVFVGLITGVGGGVLRDVFSGERPYIFVRHFYACASIIGALICALCWNRLGANVAMLFGAAAIVVLRLLAAYYHWSLPKSDYHDDTQTPTALRN